MFLRGSAGVLVAGGLLAGWLLVEAVLAQPPGPPRARMHTATQSSGEPALVPATEAAPTTPQVSITVEGDQRVIRANGIPNHAVGQFPNRGNPHEIRAQSYVLKVPARPRLAENTTPLGLQDFGIAVNGVPFDPGAAEWFRGQRGSDWQYEALSGAVALGLDANHGHVQPTGAYHYHGLPKTLFEQLGAKAGSHSPIVGWAADGFPIYALYGYTERNDAESPIKVLKSSYRLKSGERPRMRLQPGGAFDGTFIADYEYVKGSGDLDECNGRVTRTPEYPNGIYAYFLTEAWPVIPRCYKGTPSKDFERKRRARRR